MIHNINIKSENLKKNFYFLINNSDLPISNIYYIITILQKELEYEYYATLNSEAMQQAQEQNKKEEVQNEQSNESIQEN